MSATYLGHFVALALPGQPLVVQGISVCADVNGLPVYEVARPLADVENFETTARRICGQPLFTVRHIMAPWTHLLVERNSSTIF